MSKEDVSPEQSMFLYTPIKKNMKKKAEDNCLRAIFDLKFKNLSYIEG
jgi:hypothetical protein